MSDIFREVDEEIRRDKAAEFWGRYGNVIIGLAVLLVLAVAGWRYYSWQEQKKAEAIGAQFESALKASREDRSADAEKALLDIVGTAPGGYKLVAKFRLAAETAKSDPAAGATAFETLSADSSLDVIWRDLARLRAGMLRVDAVTYAELKPLLEPLATPNGAWRHSARELLGVSALKSGTPDEAGRWFDTVLTDPQTPAAMRGRVDLYLALVRGGPVTVKP
jgi:hypothetical protein